jgi:predicted aspartyl protease
MTTATVPFRLAAEDRPLLLVPTSVNGSGPFDFVLDTGASGVLIGETLAADLALERSEPVAATGAGGTLRVVRTRLDSVCIGEICVKDLEAAIADLSPIAAAAGTPIMGIVGHPVLARLVVTVDYPRRRLTLQSAEG